MGDFIQSASAVLARANARAEDAAHNIANAATPGYRARSGFSEMMSGPAPVHARQARIDLSPGKLQETGGALDVAVEGAGYLAFEDLDGLVYARNGQLALDDEGRLVGAGGRALVAEGGGDIRPGERSFEITADGVVLADGEPVARIALFDRLDAVAAPGPDGFLRFTGETAPAAERRFRQGWLESSNVTLGQEMLALMESVRRAESGQRLMNTYDDLMGRVITTFGQSPS